MRRSLLAAESSGCAHETVINERGVTTYYDHDGRVDFEFHDLGGGYMDWALADRNYDGVYDIRLRYGYGLGIDRVHLTLPRR